MSFEFGVFHEFQRRPDKPRLQRPRDLAFRPHHVWTEVRPLPRRVVAEAHEEDLRFVLEEELAREAEEQPEREQGGKGDAGGGARRPLPKSMRHVVVIAKG